MKKLIMLTAATALVTSSIASAQTPPSDQTSPSPQTSPSVQTPPSVQSSPSAQTSPSIQTPSASNGAILTSIPPSHLTVTDWYKQDVYDTQDNKIGKIEDVLLGQDGKISTLIVGVGGFLGAGEKDVAVNFSDVKQTMKNDKVYLTMDATKDALKAAPGFKYDSSKTTWVPDKA